MSNKAYSARELIKLSLSVLPRSIRGIMDRAKAERWPYVTVRSEFGGGSGGSIKLYEAPGYVQAAIAHQQLKSSDALVDVNEAGPVVALTDRQHKVAHARAAILAQVQRRAVKVGRSKAIVEMVAQAEARILPEALQAQVALASQSGTITTSTLWRWLKDFDLRRGDAVERLAPKAGGMTRRRQWQKDNAAWLAVALKLYQKPSKPSLREVHRQLPQHLPAGVPVPSYGQLRQGISQLGYVERLRGRVGARELKTVLPFIRRDTSAMWPSDAYAADGHTFDAEIAHPAHGRPFRPEITSIVDVATRRLVGWSIDLAESGFAVLDAIRHAAQVGGVPSIFYVDRGPGYRNALISAEGTGLLARLGTQLEHSIAYNSQARGVIERFHQMWVAAAKELPTYIGADMDAQAKQRVHKRTRRDVKQFGASRLLMRWPEFLQFAHAKVAQYNARPHGGLPIFVDAATGKRRHMTPDEAWARGVADGALLETVNPAEVNYLFRPQRTCKVQRGEVRLFNQLYFSHELTEFHGETVRVGYDIHDASQVWVYAEDGRFICKAGFEANKRAFFPESVFQQAAQKRAEAREKRLQARLDEVHEELHGGPLVLENTPTPTLPAGLAHGRETLTLRPDGEFAQTQATSIDSDARPIFEFETQRYEWLKRRGHEVWTESDCAFLRRYVADPDCYGLFVERFEGLGLAWTESDAQRAAMAA